MPTPAEERVDIALARLQRIAMVIAERYDVCPLCLIYALADMAARAEADGVARHEGETKH